MRFALVLCAVLFLASCDDETAYYANGEPWEPVVPKLLKNDSLIKHPYLRRMPTTEQEWTRFIQTLNAQPVANVGNIVETFTPTWTGFSVDPVGDISYFDFGKIVVMWRGENLVGTSDGTNMVVIAGVPETLWPSSHRFARCVLFNNSIAMAGLMAIGIDGQVTFSVETVSGTNIIFDNFGFVAANSKGLPQGWMIMYAK